MVTALPHLDPTLVLHSILSPLTLVVLDLLVQLGGLERLEQRGEPLLGVGPERLHQVAGGRREHDAVEHVDQRVAAVQVERRDHGAVQGLHLGGRKGENVM